MNEDSKKIFTGKKALMLFDKDEFKAEKSFLTLITDLHRRVLTKSQHCRTEEEIEMLDSLISSIARLNSFPKHIRQYIGQLLQLVVYDKGREIVREGHVAIGFYFLISGGCDVLSSGSDGLLKIDDLNISDTFGENSFQKNGITPYTVITNERSEIVMVNPREIDEFVAKLRHIEQEDILKFVKNWQPVIYWNWGEKEFESFTKNVIYLRFATDDVIYGDCKKPSDTIFFLLKGTVELISLLNMDNPKSDKKLKSNEEKINEGSLKFDRIHKFFQVCVFEKGAFFGVSDEATINTWFVARNDVNLASMSFKTFLTIHKNAGFLLSKMKDDYKFLLPSRKNVYENLKRNILWKNCLNKLILN